MEIGPIRVLHIINKFDRGGLESRIIDIYRNMDTELYQFDFYIESGEKGQLDDEARGKGARIFYNETKRIMGLPQFHLFFDFIKGHREYQFICAYNQWSGWYLKAAKKAGIKIRIACSVTSLQKKSLKNIVKNIVKYPVNKYANYKIAVSKSAGIWLFGKKNVHEGKVKIIPTAIDCSKFAFSKIIREEVRREFGLKEELALVHVGNIREVKNHPFLINVLNEIVKIEKNVHLFLVGGGDNNHLVIMAKELGLKDRIHFLGMREDVSRLLQGGDVFVFPSFYEGFPGAVIEAEASGLPCIISDSITDEVEVTDHIWRLPLNKGAQYWAKEITGIAKADREYEWKKVKMAGYDIYDFVNTIENFLNRFSKKVSQSGHVGQGEKNE